MTLNVAQGVRMRIPKPDATSYGHIKDPISDRPFHTFVSVCSYMEEVQRSQQL